MTFNGFVTVSDLHSDYGTLSKAIEYATTNNLYLVFLGDLVDSGPDPEETVSQVLELVNSGRATFVIGNHDYKHYRYFIGNNVKLNQDQIDTHNVCKDLESFAETMIELVSHQGAKFIYSVNNVVMAHASIPSSYWHEEMFSVAMRDRCLYGHVDNKEVDDKGRKKRLYEWTQDIPKDKTVVVGHDRGALNKPHLEVFHYTNSNGGQAYFTDTSCQKTPGGFASGVQFSMSGAFQKIVKFN